MEMIEEIKKALAKAENTQAYYESKKTHDWLQYLIGEVERLMEIEQEYKTLREIMDRARTLAYKHVEETEEVESMFWIDGDGNLRRKT